MRLITRTLTLWLTAAVLFIFSAAPAYAQSEVGLLEQILNALVAFLGGLFNGIIQIGEAVIGAIIWIINTIGEGILWFGRVIFAVLQFIGEVLLYLANGFVSIVGFIGAFLALVIETLIGFLVALIENIIAIIEIVALIIQVVLSLVALVFDYIGQGAGLLLAIINGLNNANATPIPGMPRCVSAPTEYQTCAVWYILDWTLLAPGTPGAFIVPFLVLVIDIIIIFYIIRSVLRIVRWFQGIYNIT